MTAPTTEASHMAATEAGYLAAEAATELLAPYLGRTPEVLGDGDEPHEVPSVILYPDDVARLVARISLGETDGDASNQPALSGCPYWCTDHEVTQYRDGVEECHLFDRRISVPGGSVRVVIVQTVGTGNAPDANVDFTPTGAVEATAEVQGDLAAVQAVIAGFALALKTGGVR